MFYGYDALGRTRAASRVGAEAQAYQQTFTYHLDGRADTMSFLLPDTGYEPELVTYRYDSAHRTTGVSWSDGGGTTEMFSAIDIDPYGRYRQVQLGNGVVESFDYDATDRRQLTRRTVDTASGQVVTGFMKHDAQLRVLQRFDATPGRGGHFTINEYDAVYRLTRSTRSWLWTWDSETFAYDGMGNRTGASDEMTGTTVTTTKWPGDPDRICRVHRGEIAPVTPVTPDRVAMFSFATATDVSRGGFTPAAPECHYRYDALGNVTAIAEPGRAVRTFSYDALSRIVRMDANGATARYAYGPDGAVASLTVTGAGPGLDRRDYRYGALIESSQFSDGGISTRVIERRIPGPLGTVAVRRGTGAGAVVLYSHGDGAADTIFRLLSAPGSSSVLWPTGRSTSTATQSRRASPLKPVPKSCRRSPTGRSAERPVRFFRPSSNS